VAGVVKEEAAFRAPGTSVRREESDRDDLSKKTP